MEFLLGSVAQTAGPLLLRGGKYFFRGTDKSILKQIQELGVGTKEAKV
jgi:hypothetical protein